MQLKEQIEKLLISGKTGKAVDLLLEVTKQSDDDNYDTLILLKSRFSENESNNIRGIITRDDYERTKNQITHSILQVIDDISPMNTLTGNSGTYAGNANTANITGSGNILIQGSESSTIHIGNREGNKPREKILFLAANPTDQARIQTDLEYRSIRDHLRSSEQRDAFELLMPEFSLTIENLLTAMNQKPAIVHFSGHGETDGIVITDKANKSQMIPEKALQRLFRQHKESTRLVVLNACYSVEQAKTISALGFYVIGMNTAVEDEAAISFATGLYIGLGAGKPVELAWDDAMIMLETEFPHMAGTPEIWHNGVIQTI